MKIKSIGFGTLALLAFVAISNVSQASGGITASPADIMANFTTRVEGNSYVVEGQGHKILIENGIVTVVTDKGTVKINGAIEITGDIETTRVDAPVNAIVDTGVTANTLINTTSTTGVTAVPTNFSGKFFQKFGIK
jgi:hypothetical protein